MEWYYLVLISSILMGAATIVEKVSLKEEYATEFSSALTVVVALLSLAFIPFANFSISPTQWLILIGLGIFNAYTFLLSARIFRHGEISVASPAFSSLPMLFTILLAFAFLGEHLNLFQYASVVMIILATYLLIFRSKKKKEMHQIFDENKYKYMIIWYALLAGAGNILGKYILSQLNPFSVLIITGTVMSVSFAIFISIKYGGVKEIAATVDRYRLPLTINSLLTLGYRVTYFVALTSASAPISIAQPLRNTFYVVITVLGGGIIFKEESLGKKLALSLIMVVFAYILTL